jgi:hypothetical protein
MRQLMRLGVVCLAAFSLVSAARAEDDGRCKDVNGHDFATLIPAPNDPLGRVLGSSTGDLKAAISVFQTSPTTAVGVWVLGPQDILIFNGAFSVTPIPGAPVGTVSLSATLTVAGGTGEFAGASGVLHTTGTGFNFFGPKAGPGSTYFEETYKGNICRLR